MNHNKVLTKINWMVKMNRDQAKYFFNAALFLLVGIISIVRHEPLNAVISFSFCGVFTLIGLLLWEPNEELFHEKSN